MSINWRNFDHHIFLSGEFYTKLYFSIKRTKNQEFFCFILMAVHVLYILNFIYHTWSLYIVLFGQSSITKETFIVEMRILFSKSTSQVPLITTNRPVPMLFDCQKEERKIQEGESYSRSKINWQRHDLRRKNKQTDK